MQKHILCIDPSVRNASLFFAPISKGSLSLCALVCVWACLAFSLCHAMLFFHTHNTHGKYRCVSMFAFGLRDIIFPFILEITTKHIIHSVVYWFRTRHPCHSPAFTHMATIVWQRAAENAINAVIRHYVAFPNEIGNLLTICSNRMHFVWAVRHWLLLCDSCKLQDARSYAIRAAQANFRLNKWTISASIQIIWINTVNTFRNHNYNRLKYADQHKRYIPNPQPLPKWHIIAASNH